MKYRFVSCTDLASILEEGGLTLESYSLARESFISGKTEAAVTDELERRIWITRASLDQGLSVAQHSLSGLTQGAAVKFAASKRRLVRDDLFTRAISYSLAVNEVNACGGKVVAFPTAGSSGIIPGVLWAWWDTRGPGAGLVSGPRVGVQANSLAKPDIERLRGAFLNASLVGVLIAQSATLAGAEGGCQAECGAAGAMAAAGLAYLEGLTLEERFQAAALSLKNSLGLACDPVAGLVEVPCVKRNAFVATNALTAVELVLSGIHSAIPFDEVVSAMKSIGDSLPQSIKENSEGGLAITSTGLRCRKKMSGY